MDREKVWLGVQKYGITIGAAVSILSLFLTMFISGDTVRDQLTQRLGGSSAHTLFSGMEVLFGTAYSEGVTLGYLLVAFPVLLLASVFVVSLKKISFYDSNSDTNFVDTGFVYCKKSNESSFILYR